MVSKVLNRPTLVLNRNWQAANVANVARALALLWNESARVVDPSDYQTYTWEDWSKLRPADGDRFIQAVRFRLRVPEVITLTDFDRLPAAAVSFSRRNTFGLISLPVFGPGAFMPTRLDLERRPPCKRNHAGANPVVGSCVVTVHGDSH